MNRIFRLALLLLIPVCTFSQKTYWQQEVHYTIDVSLNDTAHTLNGFEKIQYINHSPDTLRFIWFHLWPNAYKNDHTAFTDQELENGNTKFYFSDKDAKGYINRLDFRVDNMPATVSDHPQHIDIVKLELPRPLTPGGQITITTPFFEKLPHNFSRGGHDGQTYQITQWYPKPAVYDQTGWHAMPYLDQGEFYSEFGSFDVRITLPENYVVAATGDLQNDNEKQWLLSKAAEKINVNTKIKPGLPPSSAKTKTLQYKQDRVHDFAWFANKQFIVNHDTLALPSGRVIDVFTYYTQPQAAVWKNSISFAKSAILHYSKLVGEYPYQVVSGVQGPDNLGGGMEYPTITLLSPMSRESELDQTLTHEIGHNWFYGILASNERDHPWMDEGINTYYEHRYTAARYPEHVNPEKLLLLSQMQNRLDQPLEDSSAKYTMINYGLDVYYKTAVWLQYIESRTGTAAFDAAMQDYYTTWQFRHPQPDDLKKALEKASGQNMDSLFAMRYQTTLLPNMILTGTRFSLMPSARAIKSFLKNPAAQFITVWPAVGLNAYDKFMVGALLTNLKLPLNHFQFALAPLYATGTKQWNGAGMLKYQFTSKGLIRKTEIGLNGMRFTQDQFMADNGKTLNLTVQKIVPSLLFIFRNKDPRSTVSRWIRLQSFMLKEEGLKFFRDTLISGPDTTISNRYEKAATSRTLNRFQLGIANDRALYPWSGVLTVDQGKDFVRTGFTGNYFFNYPKGGGFDLRVFAGKFFYRGAVTPQKQFGNDRYHFNLTGANGYEDYTYSDYFIGRNKFQGVLSQQIMNRDGAFKVRTDLLADKVGKTDNWLASLNLSTTIPDAVNPLRMLPFKMPLRLFLDIGTYAETWQENAPTDRFLYDAGLDLPLAKGLVHVYFPLIYSSVFADYYKSTIPEKGRFWKKVSFTIDLSRQHPGKQLLNFGM